MINFLPEWAPHKALWTAWPSDPNEWHAYYEPARREIAGMALALAKGESVKILACGDEPLASARAAFAGSSVDVIPACFNDIWLRDTGPIFARADNGPVALTFQVNAWGGKWDFPFDREVAPFIAKASGTPTIAHDYVMEGGSLDFDGDGRVLTTKQCLLNPNRNASLSQAAIEDRLRQTFNIRQIVWLDAGLMNDHTDGHIDNIARFVAPGRVVCQIASGPNDPNAATYEAIATVLSQHGLDVIRVPSPGLVTDNDGNPVAASHMNFIIGNKVVLVPAYDDHYVMKAVEALKPLFPNREVLPLPARHILGAGDIGGGSFHCITQQEPVWEKE